MSPAPRTILAGGGPDRVNAEGGGDTGDEAFLPLTIEGGDGDDSLTGSDSNNNELRGGPGDDVLDGSEGAIGVRRR